MFTFAGALRLFQLNAFLKRNIVGIIIMAATWFIFFARVITGAYVYFLDDLKIIYYPLEVAYAQFQAAWSLPVWSAAFGFGQPLVAWGQLGFFTPVHFVLRSIHIAPLNLLQISVVAYYAIGLAGMYVFLRYLQLTDVGAALGAIIYVFSGFHVGHLNHVNFYTATMLLPWLLYAGLMFAHSPSRRRAVMVAGLGAAMALSGQPQIVLYSFAVAGCTIVILLFANNLKLQQWRYWIKLLSLAALATGLALALSTLALLPLAEFLPLTERNSALPESDLFEFSYPPHHVITLIYPYFFGNHDNYWGAKGFQELAGYVGIIPLMLAGAALSSWRVNKALRVLGLSLISIGILLALGYYSPLYRYLVVEKIITSLAIPGRFIFFFDVGIAFLAAVGLDDLIRLAQTKRLSWCLTLIASVVFPIGVLAAGIAFLWSDPHRFNYLLSNTSPAAATTAVISISVFFFLLAYFLLRDQRRVYAGQVIICAIVAGTLLLYGWNYNPLTERTAVHDLSPFPQILRSWAAATGLPPRLYSRPRLAIIEEQSRAIATSEVSPEFTVLQPIELHQATNPCMYVPMFTKNANSGRVTVGIRENLLSQNLAEVQISSREITGVDQYICFTGLAIQYGREYILSFTSSEHSGINLSYQRLLRDTSVYFVRVENPTPAQLQLSKKPGRLIVEEDPTATVDTESALLTRHLQSVYAASSARWIGALSIRPYREFIEFFFANDRDPFDGDNIHVVERYRQMFNLAGVTHFAQKLSPGTVDRMADIGFTLVNETKVPNTVLRIYENPQAFPKAFMVPEGQFEPSDDEARDYMSRPSFEAQQLVYINGPKPPPARSPLSLADLHAQAAINTYEPTRVDVAVESDHDAWLVVSDSTTPQWETYIDNVRAPYYVADTIFKAAYVPAGQHVVSFRYYSPAIARAKSITIGGLILAFVLVLPWPSRREKPGNASLVRV